MLQFLLQNVLDDEPRWALSLLIDSVARGRQQLRLAFLDVVTEFYEAVRVQDQQVPGLVENSCSRMRSGKLSSTPSGKP